MAGFDGSPAAQMLAGISGRLDEVLSKAEQTRGRLQEAAEAADQLAASESSVDETAERMESRAGDLVDTLRRTRRDVDKEMEDLRRSGPDAFDVLLERIKGQRSAWAEELRLAIAAVQAGAKSVDDFLTTWGDAQVQTADGAKRIRELLEGLDLRARSNEIQTFIRELRDGSVDIQDVTKFLTETGFVVAQQLADMITAFRDGKATIDQIAELVDFIRRNFPDSDLENLAEQIENDLRKGSF